MRLCIMESGCKGFQRVECVKLHALLTVWLHSNNQKCSRQQQRKPERAPAPHAPSRFEACAVWDIRSMIPISRK